MYKYGGLLVICVMMAGYLSHKTSEIEAEQRVEAPQVPTLAKVQEVPKKQNTPRVSGRSAVIDADNRGHFLAVAKMNGRKVEVLVDTGASSVAINRKTARRLGIHISNSDFKYKARTANGVVKTASTIIDKITIGKVTVRNVRAAILPDKALSTTLLGMTFLNQLNGFYVQNNQLVMKQ